MKSSETVLLYNFTDKEKSRKIKTILIQMGIRIKTADHSNLGDPVGYLIGIKGITPPEQAAEIAEVTAESSKDELLVMNGFNSPRLNQFLALMKKSGIPKIPYKAMITPTNQNWTLQQLFDEIRTEHHSLSGKHESDLKG